MTGMQVARPQTAVAPKPATWSEPTAPSLGRHGSVVRAKLSLRRMFYAARHAAR